MRKLACQLSQPDPVSGSYADISCIQPAQRLRCFSWPIRQPDMSCLLAHRALDADPRRLDARARAHLGECPACRTWARHLMAFEAAIEQVARGPVPPGLEARIMRRSPAPGQAFARAHGRAALAAAIVLVVSLVSLWPSPSNDPLALSGIEFVVHEEARAILESKAPDPAQLTAMVKDMGLNLPLDPDALRYIGTCLFAGETAHHVVLSTPVGKVTLLLLPGRALPVRAYASAMGLRATVAPALRGSVAIVADSARALTHVETLLMRS